MPSKPPSLLSAYLSDKAPGYASKIANGPDEPTDADDTAPRSGIAAAHSVLDALDANDPEALSDALTAIVDLHTHEPPPPSPVSAAPAHKPVLTLHVHAA